MSLTTTAPQPDINAEILTNPGEFFGIVMRLGVGGIVGPNIHHGAITSMIEFNNPIDGIKKRVPGCAEYPLIANIAQTPRTLRVEYNLTPNGYTVYNLIK